MIDGAELDFLVLAINSALFNRLSSPAGFLQRSSKDFFTYIQDGVGNQDGF
jgi:hypothetical protein